MIPEEKLFDELDAREGPVLRVECQHQGYGGVKSDGGDRLLFDRNDPVPAVDLEHGWTGQLHRDRQSGRGWDKVHLQLGDPSDYERFMFEWYFTRNERAGERIRILTVSEVLVPGLPDWHVFVDGRVLLTYYTSAGEYAGSEFAPTATARPYVALARLAWEQAVPFEDYWNARPDWHRRMSRVA